MSRRGRLCAGAAAVCVLLAGCNPQNQTQDDGSRELATQAQDIRRAALLGDRAGATQQLAELKESAKTLREGGDLTRVRSDRILAAAAQVERYLSLVRPKPAPTQRKTTAPPPPTTRPAPTIVPTEAPSEEPEPTEQPTTQPREQEPPNDNQQGNNQLPLIP